MSAYTRSNQSKKRADWCRDFSLKLYVGNQKSGHIYNNAIVS
jgi:hypothetical protein